MENIYLKLKSRSFLYNVLIVFLIQTTCSHAQTFQQVDIQKNLIIYVAPNGNDNWSGKLTIPNPDKTDGPFVSLEGARNAIREMKKKGEIKQPITVMVLEGTYYLPETFTLKPEDSGTASCTITYTAYPSHSPMICGGMKVTGWKPYNKKIWQCDLKKYGYKGAAIRQLVYNNQPQILARCPNRDKKDTLNGGYLYMPKENIGKDTVNVNRKTGVIEYDEKDWRTWQQAPTEEAKGSKRILKYDPSKLDPSKWTNLKQVEVSIFPYHNWGQEIIPIEDIDTINHTILLAREASYQLIRDTRFFVQSAFEELDTPGEWYLDRNTSVLYFYCKENPDNGIVMIPTLDRLISIEGNADANQFVEYINFGGFEIQMCKSHVFSMQTACNCTVFKNKITNIEGSGISIGENCRNIQVLGNDITRIGGSAIAVGGANNLVSNNFVNNIGLIYKVSAIYLGGIGNTVSHNLIHHIPSIGIGLSGHKNVIEFNVIHHYGLESVMSTGIYANSITSPENITGTIIRFNKITDSVGYCMYRQGEWRDSPCWGVWLDDYVSKTTVYGNILIRNVRGSVQLHGGENSLFENNILIAGLPSTMNHIRKDGRPCYNKILRNIVYYTAPDPKLMQRYGQIVTGITGNANSIAPLFFVGWAVPKAAADESDYNLFCPIGGSDLKDLYFYEGADLSSTSQWISEPIPDRIAWWRDQGFESHSITGKDPLFYDAKNEDFRLKPNSPAFELGFKPIPVDQIGLYQSPERASWPVTNK